MDWSRGHIIGHGASATVSTATLRSSGEILAVKSVELLQSEPLQREHKILSTINHPNIIGYRGCDITLENSNSMFNLIMEYAPGGTLADVIRRSGAQLDESTISHYTCGVVKGLEYLHSRGIVHCDIKLSNILLSQGEAKITDFGCAKAAEEAVIGGTPMYMSPEVARGDEQGYSADIWAVGCSIIEMATGKSPWPNSVSTLYRIAFSGETPEVPDFLSGLGKDFLSKCLRVNPEERWTAGQLFRHYFLDESRFRHVKQSLNSTCSPTCVLDHGIWSSIEDVCEMDDGELLDGPIERIKELCVNLGRDNWEWGERWITVRDSKNVNVSFSSKNDL
ncbi:hypothetical protein CASFOL_019990 [Castilleja foliolosa]|uniref:Protein kinase domain-containing protein n=1 Tax=Castilleja foliolosa TaxID=1961234 RepID=A0ABD3CZK1_9LAMI